MVWWVDGKITVAKEEDLSVEEGVRICRTQEMEKGDFFEGLESKKQNLKMNEIFYRNPDVEGQQEFVLWKALWQWHKHLHFAQAEVFGEVSVVKEQHWQLCQLMIWEFSTAHTNYDLRDTMLTIHGSCKQITVSQTEPRSRSTSMANTQSKPPLENILWFCPGLSLHCEVA